MPGKRGRPKGTTRAAASTVRSDAGTGDETSGSIRIDPAETVKVQANVEAEGFDIAAANPGFTAPVDGPQQEAGPNVTVEPTTGAEIKRGPGRPRGSGTRKPIAASGIETLLLGIHSTLLAVFKAPELDLDRDEAKQLAAAYADVAEYYPVLNFDPKYAALANFAGVVSIVYGSRVAAWRMRRMMTPQQRSRPGHLTPAAPQRAQQQTPVPDNTFVTPQVNGVDVTAQDQKRDVPLEARKSLIPGVGEIEFPTDHPMVNGKPN